MISVVQKEEEKPEKSSAIIMFLCCFPQVWVSFATFEISRGQDDSITSARAVYQEANKSLKQANAQKEERLMLLEEWRKYEVSDQGRVSFIQCFPSSLKRFVV